MKILITEQQLKTLSEVRYLRPPNYMTKNYGDEKPISDTETIRVFHGFAYFKDLETILKNGLSGKENASRIYSFEYGNNPYGLFVSIDFNLVAKNFAHGGVIIEFSTKVSDLEAPVWVGGRSYFVQGEYTKSFKDLDEREQQRILNRQRAGENPYEAISKSDRPELAETLFENYERQALYIGDLNPNMIKYIWYNERMHKNRMTDGKWKRYKRKDFVNKFNIKTERGRYDYFLPNEDFSIEKLLNNLNYDKHHNEYTEDQFLFYALINDEGYRLKQDLHMYPKQIKQIMDLRKENYFQKFIENHNKEK